MDLKVNYHLLLCSAPSKSPCCDPATTKTTWLKLKQILHQLDLENNTRSNGVVLRSKVECLRICNSGPILLVWPDGIWYGLVTPARIEVIIKKHILGGEPIDDWIIRRTPFVNLSSIDQSNNVSNHL